MVYVTRHPLSSSSYSVSIRRNVVNLSRKYHAKVSALPFALSKDEAIERASLWSSPDSVGSLMEKSDPGPGTRPRPPSEIKAMYAPAWFIDGEVTGRVIKSGTEVSTAIHSMNSYMPGFSDDTLSDIPLSQSNMEELAVPFSPKLRRQHELKVSCVPFSISPIPLLEVIKSLAPSQTKLLGSARLDPKSVDFTMLAAYPVLLPMYVVKYVLEIPKPITFTSVVRAHSKDFTIRQVLTPDSVGDLPPWEARGFPTIAVPVAPPGFGPFAGAISAWVCMGLGFGPEMPALAGHGVNMDHPCVRPFTKEEVDANRKFLVASAKTLRAFELFKRHEGIKVDEEDPGNPRALMEFLKKQMPAERDELKPRWLRDFQDSQRRGRSASP